MEETRTWHCDHCGKIFPIGPSGNDPVEWMAFAFLEGQFNDRISGFPSISFHDGYRNYNERFESWMSRYPYEDDWLSRRLDEYASGALAQELEPIWDEMQPRKKIK